MEKQQRGLSGQPQEAELAEQLSKLKEDLEYVRVSVGIACNFYGFQDYQQCDFYGQSIMTNLYYTSVISLH